MNTFIHVGRIEWAKKMSHAVVLFQSVCQADSEVEQLSRHFSQNIYFYTISVWNKKFFMRRSHTSNLLKGLILSGRIDICLKFIHVHNPMHPPHLFHYSVLINQWDIESYYGRFVRRSGNEAVGPSSSLEVMRSCCEKVKLLGHETVRKSCGQEVMSSCPYYFSR